MDSLGNIYTLMVLPGLDPPCEPRIATAMQARCRGEHAGHRPNGRVRGRGIDSETGRSVDGPDP